HEFDNLRLAVGWSRQEDSYREVGLRLYGALRWFWYLRGHLSEGRVLGEALLNLPGGLAPTVARARALASAGGVALLQSDFPAARRWLSDSVEICRRSGDAPDLAMAVGLLALTELRLGDVPAAATLAAESVGFSREVGGPWLLAWSFDTLGYVHVARRD